MFACVNVRLQVYAYIYIYATIDYDICTVVVPIHARIDVGTVAATDGAPGIVCGAMDIDCTTLCPWPSKDEPRLS